MEFQKHLKFFEYDKSEEIKAINHITYGTKAFKYIK